MQAESVLLPDWSAGKLCGRFRPDPAGTSKRMIKTGIAAPDDVPADIWRRLEALEVVVVGRLERSLKNSEVDLIY